MVSETEQSWIQFYVAAMLAVFSLVSWLLAFTQFKYRLYDAIYESGVSFLLDRKRMGMRFAIFFGVFIFHIIGFVAFFLTLRDLGSNHGRYNTMLALFAVELLFRVLFPFVAANPDWKRTGFILAATTAFINGVISLIIAIIAFFYKSDGSAIATGVLMLLYAGVWIGLISVPMIQAAKNYTKVKQARGPLGARVGGRAHQKKRDTSAQNDDALLVGGVAADTTAFSHIQV